MLTLGSLFNGISGWVISAEKYGVKTLWESEVDEYCEAVTAHHFPDVKQLGDITKINGAEIEPVDIICAGSPCQNLSLAGKREGLKGEQSGLFFRAIDIVRQMRMSTGGRYPRYFVWENVPGAFSSNNGMDFRAVLSEVSQTEIPIPANNKWAEAGMVEWNGGSLAWRTLDAQHWGCAQRRKRIFLVADFASGSAGEILFECQGLSGDSSESEGTGEGSSESTGTSTDSTGKCVAYSIVGNTIGRKLENGGNGKGIWPECSYTLNTTDRHAVFRAGGFGSFVEDKVAGTAKASGGDFGGGSETLLLRDYKDAPIVNAKKTVRRLTPLECERLQGLPDGYTDIEFRGKPAPDSRRYKAIGNGMAVPCSDYVMRRIVEVYESEQPSET
jgi:DNA (cytosine-5)-methyltransferase 1